MLHRWTTSLRALLAIALLCNASIASGAPLMPSETQIASLGAGQIGGEVGIVQLLSVRENRFVGSYISMDFKILTRSGGQRVYIGNLDVLPDGQAQASFEILCIDLFPDRASAENYITVQNPLLEKALDQRFALALAPHPSELLEAIQTIESELHALFPRPVEGAPELQTKSKAGTLLGFDPVRVRQFMEEEQTDSLMLLSLNEYRDKALYSGSSDENSNVSGEQAFDRFVAEAFWNRARVGGRTFWRGSHSQTLIGDPKNPLGAQWSDISLLHYPTRISFRAVVMSEDYRTAARHRSAGLEKSVMLPGTPWPTYDPTP